MIRGICTDGPAPRPPWYCRPATRKMGPQSGFCDSALSRPPFCAPETTRAPLRHEPGPPGQEAASAWTAATQRAITASARRPDARAMRRFVRRDRTRGRWRGESRTDRSGRHRAGSRSRGLGTGHARPAAGRAGPGGSRGARHSKRPLRVAVARVASSRRARRRDVRAVAAEIEDVSLGQPDVLHQLPGRMRRTARTAPPEAWRQAFDGVVEGRVRSVPREGACQPLANRVRRPPRPPRPPRR